MCLKKGGLSYKMAFNKDLWLKYADNLSSFKGDYADIYASSYFSKSFYLDDNKLEEVSCNKGSGCGVRLLKDEAVYYVYSPGISAEVIDCLMKNLSSQTEAGSKKLILDYKHDDSFIQEADDFDINPEILWKVNDFVRKSSSFVRQVAIRYSTTCKNVIVANLNGRVVFDKRVYTSFGLHIVVERDSQLQTGYEREAFLCDPKAFWKRVNPFELAEKALKRALLMLDAKPAPAGAMPVVLAGEAGGTLIHEACGHGLEIDIIKKDFSVYEGKLGQKVASEAVTLIDDGTIPEAYGTTEYDDEGTKTKKNVLIKNGILEAYLTDIYANIYYGVELTGNGRRQSYKDIPIPRMTNTYIAAGDKSPQEILDKVKEGLYVVKMGGGQVNPTSGDFVFHAEEAYIIKDGKVKDPVKGAILTGNGPMVLENIVEVADDLYFMPGVCGKDGQHVPVTDGQPTVLISKIIVGGTA